MLAFIQLADAVAATTKKKEKVRLVADYLRTQPVDTAAHAAIFLSGRAFPMWDERTLQVGGTSLWKALTEVSGKPEVSVTAAYRRHGDLGAAARDLLTNAPAQSTLTVVQLSEAFTQIARLSGPAPKRAIVEDLLRRATALEATYIIKIISGDLRIGLRESLVEEAIAVAFSTEGAPIKAADVQRANMLLGDIGETLRLAARHQLDQARMRLFHPLGLMLASPAQDAEEAFSYFTEAAVEDKYDGMRCQAHCGGNASHATGGRVRLFSRTLDEISESYPEIPPALQAFPDPVVLDGEILAWSESLSQALPFSELQKRLGRKKVSRELMRSVPVVYMVFDVLYAHGELTIELPLRERRKLLEELFASVPENGFNVGHDVSTVETSQGQLMFEPAVSEKSGPPRVILAPMFRADSAAHLDELFQQARDRGNEGLMVKDLGSAYAPGRRGKSWLKLKRELATLDVVVTAVEWGHGKRNKVLSDYTFAIRDGEQLLNVGKAYSGLTDAEIAEMTTWFQEHTLDDHGFRRTVDPQVVLEVAFNNVMQSDRHESGYALRFPRILRIRTDKSPEDIDTLETVREIYERQNLTA